MMGLKTVRADVVVVKLIWRSTKNPADWVIWVANTYCRSLRFVHRVICFRPDFRVGILSLPVNHFRSFYGWFCLKMLIYRQAHLFDETHIVTKRTIIVCLGPRSRQSLLRVIEEFAHGG